MTAMDPPGQRSVRRGSWRDPSLRAYAYQAVVFALVAALAYRLFRNTLDNLAAKGLPSGFGFLSNEAGFGITEALPVPRLAGALLVLLGSLAAGLLAVWGLACWRRARGGTLGESDGLVLLALVLTVFLPGMAFYLTRSSFQVGTYTEASTYGMALIVGVLNTIKVSLLGCALATLVGVLVGIARLSTNFLVETLAAIYVEVLRNIPVLLQIFFWYFAVLQTLPGVHDSIAWPGVALLNNRGIFLPNAMPAPGSPWYLLLSFGVLLAIVYLARIARRERDRSGRRIPVTWLSLGLLLGAPAAAWWLVGPPVELTYPELQGFNIVGALTLSPEYAALLFGLTVYSSALIAEIVRSGIQAVTKGQHEAAHALGLKRGQVLRLVILPQALRVIVPPLTSQYLNLTKNSSLGVAVAYPELVAVGGTAINQSGQAVEIIGLTMGVYLTISLLISFGMNWYNRSVRLVGR